MRCISLLITLCALLVTVGLGQETKTNPALSGQVEQAPPIARIADADGKREGVSTLVFPPGTRLADAPFPNMVSYEGEWRAGLAEGQGLIRFPSNPPGYMAQAPAGVSNYYIGQFSSGRPTGEGVLVYRGLVGREVKVSGLFSGSQIVVSVHGQDRAVFTPVGSDNSKGLVRLMLYPHVESRLPSRVFFGEVTNGNVTGDWVDVPWYEERDGGIVAGYGRYLEVSLKDGSYSCTYEPRIPDTQKQAQELIANSTNFNLLHNTIAVDFLYRSKATCTSIDSEGWSFTHEVDFSPITPKVITVLGCKTPDGEAGTMSGDRCLYKKKKKKKHDFFTNMGQEGLRLLKRVTGTITKGGKSVEKAVCRATGTEPGKNCHVGISVGATWPVGDEPASNLPAEEEAARQRFITASRRASRIPDAFGRNALGEVAGLTAELLAVCNALCESGSQQQYSAALLSELERVANLPANESSIRTIASINRETASVVSTGLRLLKIGLLVAGPSIAYKRLYQSTDHAVLILSAIDAVHALPGQPSTFEELKRKNQALAALYNLNNAHLINMSSHGANFFGASIKSAIPILRGMPPQRASALSHVIAIGKTVKQINEFVEKYKDVKSEEELYNAIISEAVAPLGIKWPPPL